MVPNKRRVLAMLAAIVVVGIACTSILNVGSSSANSPLVAEVVDERGEFKLTVTLQKSLFEPGEPINMTFTVANIGNRTIGFWNVDSRGVFDFIVYNESSSNLYQWSLNQIFWMSVFGKTLDPGENFSRYLDWDQTCGQDGYSEGVRVSAGRYYIIGELHNGPTTDSPEGYMVQVEPFHVYIGEANLGEANLSEANPIQTAIIVGVAVTAVATVLVCAVLGARRSAASRPAAAK